MPFLMIQTNIEREQVNSEALIAKASKTVSEQLGKSENYVMVALEANTPMSFAGDNAPLAYLEPKSIGLPEDRTAELSEALCELVNSETGIQKDRIYIEFSDAPRNMWGWNGRTF